MSRRVVTLDDLSSEEGDSSSTTSTGTGTDDDNGSSEGEWEVEKILDVRKTKDGIAKYLVKWKGWPVEDSTWEPASNVVHAMDLVDAFHEEEAKKNQETFRPKQVENKELNRSQAASVKKKDGSKKKELDHKTEVKEVDSKKKKLGHKSKAEDVGLKKKKGTDDSFESFDLLDVLEDDHTKGGKETEVVPKVVKSSSTNEAKRTPPKRARMVSSPIIPIRATASIVIDKSSAVASPKPLLSSKDKDPCRPSKSGGPSPPKSQPSKESTPQKKVIASAPLRLSNPPQGHSSVAEPSPDTGVGGSPVDVTQSQKGFLCGGELVGIFEMDGKKHFVVEWHGQEDLELVPFAEANTKWPQSVINYFENITTWH